MSHRRHTALYLAGLVLAFAFPTAANAGLLVADAPSCEAQDAATVFSPWADPAYYVLAPGGAAESSEGWSTTPNANFVPGNEPWQIHGASDSTALRLPPGASATTA